MQSSAARSISVTGSVGPFMRIVWGCPNPARRILPAACAAWTAVARCFCELSCEVLLATGNVQVRWDFPNERCEEFNCATQVVERGDLDR
jgi:hypothetical protein